jgi:hypothetical protein
MAMRACDTSDDRLFAFVDGLDESLDEHVAGCDECQAFLAELWTGELETDLSEPVMRTIRFDEFLSTIARLGLDIAAAMGRALVEYGPGGETGGDGEDR